MALLRVEGFDHVGTDEAWLEYKGWYMQSSNIQVPSPGRFGVGNCLYISSYNYSAWWFVPGAAQSTIYMGMALQKSAGAPAYYGSNPWMQFRNSTNDTHVCFYWLGDYTLEARRGVAGTVLGTSSSPLPDTGWFYLEFKIVVHASAGEVVVRLNGDTIMNLTSQDTHDSGTADIAHLLIRGPYLKQCYWDDMYMDTSQFHGDSVVRTFLPDANGTYTDFTPSAGSNYQNVDESPPDEDTTYNEGNDEGEKDSYGITTSGINGPIKGVQLSNFEKKTGGLTVKTKPLLRTGGSDFLGDETNLTADYAFNQKLWEVNPDTTNPWTPGELDSAEFGVEITAMSTTTTTT